MNTTNISRAVGFEIRFGWVHFWVTLCLLGTLILCTIIGNVFVVAAILLEKHLQGVSNYLILSLAVADLMVATLPMPLSAINEVSEEWWLGSALCDFWICSDVLCCTASILHLVGIALDRYWAVTNAEYIRKRTAKRIGFMITMFWLLSIAISLPARFNITRLRSWVPQWNDANSSYDQSLASDCGINKEYGYTIFSTVGAFYMPMIFMMCIYARIYIVAKERIRRSTFRKRVNSLTEPTTIMEKSNHKTNQSRNSNKQHRLTKCPCFGCCKTQVSKKKLVTPINSLNLTQGISTKSKDQSAGETNGNLELKNQKIIKSPGYFNQIWTKVKSSSTRTNARRKPVAAIAPKVPSPDAFPQNQFTVLPDTNNPCTSISKMSFVDQLDLLHDASNNLSGCHQCLGQLLVQAVGTENNFRLLPTRISHSAPPSVFGSPKQSYSSISSTPDSSCYTANRSEKSDAAAWSSSCSVVHRTKSSDCRAYNSLKFYSMMKTFIVRKQQASVSLRKNEDSQLQSRRLMKRKWVIPKLGPVSTSRSTSKVFIGKAPGKRLSKSCSGPQTRNDTVENKHFGEQTEDNVSEIALTGERQDPVNNKIEMDYESKGTINLEARLKSTVGEVTKLATVTAMVRRERLENQRERKAVITLAIITGCFMLCWLPFFIVALLSPFYENMKLSKVGQDIILWLGYSNSLLNPIIYTIFSPDFRNAFRKILFGRYYLRYRDR